MGDFDHDPHVLPGKRVVVCEDQGITLLQLQMALQAGGLDVVGSAVTGAEAVEIVLRERPDIAVIDIGLPDLNGLIVARRIRRAYPVCLVILSGHAEEEYLDEAFRLGVDAYLIKPVTGQDLLSGIQDAWRNFETVRKGATDRTRLHLVDGDMD